MEELKERSQGGVARADHLSDAAHNLRDGDLAGGGGATKYITNNIINPVIASRNAVGEKMTVGNGFGHGLDRKGGQGLFLELCDFGEVMDCNVFTFWVRLWDLFF